MFPWCVPAARASSSCTARTAPHRMAPQRPAAPHDNPPASQHSRSRHLQATLVPSRFSKAARTTDCTGSAHVGPLGVWRRSRGGSSARGTGKRAHDARDAHVKAVMVVLVLVEAAVKERSLLRAKACTACLDGLPHLTGRCCAVESADSVCWEDPWAHRDRGRGRAEEGVDQLVMRDRETGRR